MMFFGFVGAGGIQPQEFWAADKKKAPPRVCGAPLTELYII